MLANIAGLLLGLSIATLIMWQPIGRPRITLRELVQSRSTESYAQRRRQARVDDLAGTKPIFERFPIAERLLRRPLLRLGNSLDQTLFRYGIGNHDELIRRLRLVRPGVSPAAYRSQQIMFAIAAGMILPVLNFFGIHFFGPWPWWMWIALALIGAWWPSSQINSAMKERRARMDAEIPVMIDVFVLGSSAGQAPEVLLRQCGTLLTGPLGAALYGIAREAESAGGSYLSGIEELALRDKIDELRQFADAWRLAREQGTPLSASLGQISIGYRQRRHAARQEKMAALQVKMLIPLGCLILPSLFIIIMYPLIAEAARTLGSL